MFDSILIANRGEIACRVIRSARRLGLRCIAVFHHVDRHAQHVRDADDAIEIAAASPTAAYLDSRAIVAAAQQSGAECIHPGYGFLAENAAFAALVENSGISFVGPQSAVIELMGDKVRAREFAAEAGVPLAPSVRLDADFDAFLAAAGALEFPLLIKAAAGGGGKGMSIVRTPDELRAAALTAMSEAERYFADGRIYAERYIERPRHIEVQVVGDRTGAVVHLGERECSVQRRFQKIIEESPAPSLPPELREQILSAAVELTRRAAYRNAGTVEFILAPDGAFYFLEMNTRLQVEHPVTEMVYGVDLVEAQLRIAAGEKLPWAQSDLVPRGHAIECRVCCEQPELDFRPATGRVGILRHPEGEGIRFDGALYEGLTVSAAFDSMVGKLIACGADRDAALARLRRALQQFVLLGVSHNLDYLQKILAHHAFGAGELHTGFVEEHAAALLAPSPDADLQQAILAAAALSIEEFRDLAYLTPEPHASIGAWRN